MGLRVTKSQIQEFMSSMMWKDMQRELIDWRKDFEKEMFAAVNQAINQNEANMLTRLGDLHGRCMAIDYVLQMPKVFLTMLNNLTKEREDDES